MAWFLHAGPRKLNSGPLEDRTFQKPLDEWKPLRPDAHPEEKPAPFKIGALDLPMVTWHPRMIFLGEIPIGPFFEGQRQICRSSKTEKSEDRRLLR